MKMNAKVMQILSVFVLILNSMKLIKAQHASLIENAVGTTTCYNPNRHLGNCISIYECNSLRYVLEHRLRPLYGFVRASQCVSGQGRAPFVCCTKEIRFETEIVPRYSERIVFPDEIERRKRKKTESTTTTTTSTTTLTTELFLETETSSENSMIDFRTEFKTKFPKPPNCGGFTFSNKIYGGHNAELGEFSWMVILEYRNLTTGQLLMDCSGSIINERYIVTAAHCVQGEILKVNGRLESVRIGEHNTDTTADCDETSCLRPYQRIRIDAVIPHADYNVKNNLGARNQHDIALLRLERPLAFNDELQPACLPDVRPLKPLEANTRYTVAGWGHNGSRPRTAVKQKVELPFIKHDKCRQIFSKKFYLADEQICAGGKFREDSCNGDSGGPLMVLNEEYWTLEGIVSFGLGCGLERPGVYTNVRHYLNWIDEHVKSD